MPEPDVRDRFRVVLTRPYVAQGILIWRAEYTAFPPTYGLGPGATPNEAVEDATANLRNALVMMQEEGMELPSPDQEFVRAERDRAYSRSLGIAVDGNPNYVPDDEDEDNASESARQAPARP